MQQHDGGAFGANGDGLPVALAKDAAGDLCAARGADFNEFRDRWWEMILPRKEVAGDGLQMTIGEPATRMKRGKLRGPVVFVAGTAHPVAPRDEAEDNAAAFC